MTITASAAPCSRNSASIGCAAWNTSISPVRTATSTIKAPIERIETAVGLVKNRVNFIGELWDNCSYLFQAPTEFDEKSLKKWWKDEAPKTTAELCDFLEAQPDWNGETLEPKVMDWIASKGYATGKVMNALRVTLVGAAMGPQIFCITDFIGREETLKRARKAISELSSEA